MIQKSIWIQLLSVLQLPLSTVRTTHRALRISKHGPLFRNIYVFGLACEDRMHGTLLRLFDPETILPDQRTDKKTPAWMQQAFRGRW